MASERPKNKGFQTLIRKGACGGGFPLSTNFGFAATRVANVDKRGKNSSLRVAWPNAINQEGNFRQMTTEPGIDRPVLFLSNVAGLENGSSTLEGLAVRTIGGDYRARSKYL